MTVRPGTVYLVGAGPGDPGLITVRGLELLARADVVAHDRLAPETLLARALPTAELIDVGKRRGRATVAQHDINELLIDRARRGEGDAWEELVERLGGLVWSVARGFRLTIDEAEDIGQATWLRLVENLDRIRDPERLGLWLATTARREAMRYLNRQSRTLPTEPCDHALTQRASEERGHEQVDDASELEGLPEALERMERRETMGRTILEW